MANARGFESTEILWTLCPKYSTGTSVPRQPPAAGFVTPVQSGTTPSVGCYGCELSDKIKRLNTPAVSASYGPFRWGWENKVPNQISGLICQLWWVRLKAMHICDWAWHGVH